ncbi:MAG: hypothetical protein GEU73_13450 [Chloroflexi bacterium]|nr:hypothetical protein [Chloroflexota bacterium]
MADWLLLLHKDVGPADTLAALRAAVPPPWGRVVILDVLERWWPLTSGVPAAYRMERQRALREVWNDQEQRAWVGMAGLAAAMRADAVAVEFRLALGDSVREAHRLARELGVALIVIAVPAERRLLRGWPASVARRLARDAPCSVLLARSPVASGKRRLAAEALPSTEH